MKKSFWIVSPLIMLGVSAWTQNMVDGSALRAARNVDISDSSSNVDGFSNEEKGLTAGDTPSDTVTDFLSLQVSNNQQATQVHHYLGVNFQGIYGIPQSKTPNKNNLFHASGGVGLSYVAVWGNNYIPYVGVELEAAALYTYLFHNKYNNNHLITPIITGLLRVHLASPVYLGVGVNFGINLWKENTSKLYIAPVIKLGLFQSFRNFALDVSTFWTCYAEQSDITKLYGKNSSIYFSHGFGFKIGFYGILG